MKRSNFFMNTLKEVPSDAEVLSHKLMLRAGMIRKVAAGIYDFLPLSLMVMKKIKRIIREELNKAGAQEVFLPAIIPAEFWKETGRWDQYGKELLRIKDRHDREFCFGPTHEEVITDLVRKEVKSYRQLPVNLYQIQTKFRDEIRPRFGVMRAREFLMKDGYSFDADEKGAEKSYRNMFSAYVSIFSRCGLKFRAVDADTGNIGGSFSHEFMVLADSGEDFIVSCSSCDYAANMEKAESKSISETIKDSNLKEIELVETPEKKSVADITEFLKIDEKDVVKTLIFETEKGVVAALVRGDHDVNEVKLKKVMGTDIAVLASEKIVKEVTLAPSGYAGPVNLGIQIIADSAVSQMQNFVVGANQADSHFINVNTPKDFSVTTFGDIRNVKAGDECLKCGGTLKIDKGIEVGHIFKLGQKYSKSMNANYISQDGSVVPMVMGCYGIGVARTMAASIEQNSDENGIIWPIQIAPFQVTILPLNFNHEKSTETAEEIYQKLLAMGIETLIDDRDERAGIKFKDADLIGIPLQVIIGEKSLNQGKIEIKRRFNGEKSTVSVEEVIPEIKKILSALAL